MKEGKKEWTNDGINKGMKKRRKELMNAEWEEWRKEETKKWRNKSMNEWMKKKERREGRNEGIKK